MRWRLPFHVVILGCCTAVAIGVAIAQTAGASASPPPLTISTLSGLHSGESISVSVGANSYYTPYAAVNIVECADPGGTKANLPTDDSKCDGNTIESNSVLIAANGSFSEPSYTLYSLPNAVLGEEANAQPVCDLTNPCVLYIGQDQNDFTKPKEFSSPFTIAPSSGTATPTGSTTVPGSSNSAATPASTTTTTEPAGSAADDAVSLTAAPAADPATLPNTGAPADVAWLLACGLMLVFLGSLGRQVALRARP